MNCSRLFLSALTLSCFTFVTSCSDDDDNNEAPSNNLVAPDSYVFERDGATSVAFPGQTTRIQMGNEFKKKFKQTNLSVAELKAAFSHEEGNNDFDEDALNSSGKNLRSKIAASKDFFETNTSTASQIKNDFDAWIEDQVNTVFPNWDTIARAGVAGNLQELGGGSDRYVNGKGLENDQAWLKGLIGGLMTDQILNNYTSPSVLDEAQNRANNDAGITEEGKNYTTMEHKWDEAFGYAYGNEPDPANPVLGQDEFLNKYIEKVNNDPDFNGIAQEIFDAFALGRLAIVNKDYELRDQQAKILREKISQVIAIRAVFYLQAGIRKFNDNDVASAFHQLSEGFGFIYGLQFTRQTNSNAPYFTNAEVNGMIDQLLSGNGFWDVDESTLNQLSSTIASKFNFTVEAAAFDKQ